eukprot:CAMPEP_0206047886 /NCGR_PEP_ID=MMETSP1466-20131121/22557_1 /ASSEMBLY_ACC=CAM_ASM_001126 /TAXON_ID=44452 /ORGANISM="Pavlova gyrans, Strain CCMP608" /LENGTH=647 /DNA_ID=CAMNT_0053422913 /DNA_START=1 /DNA_END=1944 /DNA_ORIENTATION=-
MDGLVDRATEELLIGSDWTINLEVCDRINQREEYKDACLAIRRRLAHKSPKVVLLALTLLETCMKNCAEAFHSAVASRDFQGDIMKLASAKGEVAERTRELVESWADAFQTEGDPQFVATYRQLLDKGVSFPRRDVGKAAPLFTPPAKLSPAGAGAPTSPATRPDPAPLSSSLASASAGGDTPAESRHRPVFAGDLEEVDGEVKEDKNRPRKWTFGLSPGYTALANQNEEDDDEDDGGGGGYGGGEGCGDAMGHTDARRAGSRPAAASSGPVVGSEAARIRAQEEEAERARRKEAEREEEEALNAAIAASQAEAEAAAAAAATTGVASGGGRGALDPSSPPLQIQAEVEEVDNQVSVLRDCLSAVGPGAQGGDLEANDVVQELMGVLRAAEPKILVLIQGAVNDENVLAELLRVHANVRAALDVYDEKLALALSHEAGASGAEGHGHGGGRAEGAHAGQEAEPGHGSGGSPAPRPDAGAPDLLGLEGPGPAPSPPSQMDQLAGVFGGATLGPIPAVPQAREAAAAGWGGAMASASRLEPEAAREAGLANPFAGLDENDLLEASPMPTQVPPLVSAQRWQGETSSAVPLAPQIRPPPPSVAAVPAGLHGQGSGPLPPHAQAQQAYDTHHTPHQRAQPHPEQQPFNPFA